MRRIAFLGSLILSFSFYGIVHADLVVRYQIANATTTPVISAQKSIHVLESGLSAGAGLTPLSASPWRWTGWDSENTSYADAVAAGDYWTWGFQLKENDLQLELSTLDLRLGYTATAPTVIEIRASINGGAALSLFTHPLDGSDTTLTDVDISSVPTVTPGDSVDFILAGFNSTFAEGHLELRPTAGYGLYVEGEYSEFVAIPEPGAWSFGALVVGVIGVSQAWKKYSGRGASDSEITG